MKRPDWPVAIVGAGTMGHGIAQLIARCGFEVRLYDETCEALGRAKVGIEPMLDKALARGTVTREQKEQTLARIRSVDTLEEAVEGCRVVIEAVPEDPAIKEPVFRRLDRLAPPTTLLASNTSAISITLIASWTEHRDRVVGLHFFNPPDRMPLVEVVKGLTTSDKTIERATRFCEQIGKETIVVNDRPGFATSRLSAAIGQRGLVHADGRSRLTAGDRQGREARARPSDGSVRAGRPDRTRRPSERAPLPARDASATGSAPARCSSSTSMPGYLGTQDRSRACTSTTTVGRRMTETVRSVVDSVDGIATVTVDRPERRNALSAGRCGSSSAARCGRCARDPETRGVLITGAGDRAFVAGADIAELVDRPPEVALDGVVQGILNELEDLPFPTVAAHERPRAGRRLGARPRLRRPRRGRRREGGLPGDRARHHAGGRWHRGGCCSTSGSDLRRSGSSPAGSISAEEAADHGLINRVVEPAALVDSSTELLGVLAAQPRLAFRLAKATIGAAARGHASDELERVAYALTFTGPERTERMRRFLDGARSDGAGETPSPTHGR